VTTNKPIAPREIKPTKFATVGSEPVLRNANREAIMLFVGFATTETYEWIAPAAS